MKSNITALSPFTQKKKIHLAYLLLSSLAIWSGIFCGLFESGHFNASSLRYFTYLSNIISATGLMLLLIFYNKVSFPRHACMSVILLAISVTGIIYNFVLVPLNGHDIFYKSYQNFSNHLMSMLLVVANYIIFEKKGLLKYRHILLGMIFPFLYWSFFIVFGGSFGSYPYFFMDLNTLSVFEAIAWLLALLSLFLFLGLLLLFFDSYKGKKINLAYNIFCRIYQFIFKLVAVILPWRNPILIEGENSLYKIPAILTEKNINTVLVLVSNTLYKSGLSERLSNDLAKSKIKSIVFKDIEQNPTIATTEKSIDIFRENNCQAIIALGGGSVIDCAKATAAGAVKKKKLIKMKGVLKVRKKLPTLIAVPTTAGTGSEVTLAAVLLDDKTHLKFAINDISLIPHYAILDPLLTVNLPKSITAATGMDAMTHAIEAYIGRSNTKNTHRCAEKALKLIGENILIAYNDGSNIEARKNMLAAAHLAGKAFTRAYVGNVHAAAHTLSGFYGISHGVANAAILPLVLEYYGSKVHKKLAKVAKIMKIGESVHDDAQKSDELIKYIKGLNAVMGIPISFTQIKESDLPHMINNALKEANPLYPVPQIFNKHDFENIFKSLQQEEL